MKSFTESWKYLPKHVFLINLHFRPTLSLSNSNCTPKSYLDMFHNYSSCLGSIECSNGSGKCCNIYTDSLIHDNYERFAKLMKQSLVLTFDLSKSNKAKPIYQSSDFIEKYANKFTFFKLFNLTMSPGTAFSYIWSCISIRWWVTLH